MPLDGVIVSAWLSDVQAASSRKRPRNPVPRQPRKRRALFEVAGNMNMEPESPLKSLARRRSPRKCVDAPKDTTRGRQAREERASGEAPLPEGKRGRTAGCDTALDNLTHPILSPSSSSQYTVAISANTASVEQAPWDVGSAGQKSKSSGRRPPSPTKTVSDMEMLDKPFRYCFHDKDEHPLPPEISSHWEVLETLCSNVGIIPAAIKVCCQPLRCSN
ncbi:uncharacterized protein BDZ99DRAFT_112166 [Mytilinidion resinicola]|uniref:Uncharacterized protein n=1 Tax=Mytilinidion resinicola TaxID=574789 RepID=A0A6A6YAM2_9PEZI|nr:uncharacterized protein BDZ99DRAFT_112166 [Mytilinidion resinicola]KAF2805054.1 hypothetical protein BDZ99DRAFT_112166 [Mytilinidion resinicola]